MTKARPTPEHARIVVAADQPMSYEPLRHAIDVFNGLVRHGWTAQMPSDLDADSVRTHLVAHLAFERAVVQKDLLDRQFSAAEAARRHEAGVLLARVKGLVDAWYPRGHAARGAFFPTGAGDHTMTRRLAAAIDGLTRYPIAGIPDDVRPENLQRKLDDFEKAHAEMAEVDGVRTGTVTISREQHQLRTREIATRLRALVTGIVGRGDTRLVDFGMSPTVAKRKPRAKRKPAPAPDVTNGVASSPTTH